MDYSFLAILEKNLGYSFQNQELLVLAITHKSYLNDREKDPKIKEHNERLEFLGDAVLELVVTDYLYNNFRSKEGHLTALRASLVNYKLVGKVGNELGLAEIILLSRAEKEELGKARLTIVADCVEAVIGAMFLDGKANGYGISYNFIKDKILCKLPEIITDKSYLDSKTKLQELVQKNFKVTPHYKVLDSTGKDHEKVFNVGVYVSEKLVAKGNGRSKQAAETKAASIALEVLKTQIEQTFKDE